MFLVGVDSGGTHTNIRITSPDGEERSISEIDKALSSTRSNSELREVFDQIFASIYAYSQGAPCSVWINAAGYSAASQRRIEGLLSEAIASLDVQVGISNDGVGIMLAHDSELVTIVAGTGSVAMARNPQGHVIKRGGDEWVASDYGSAFWLGLEGIRSAYAAMDSGIETVLLKCLLERFSPLHFGDSERDVRAVVQEIVRGLAGLGTDTKSTIASFAPQVTRQAELGDEKSRDIVRAGAIDLAEAACGVYRTLASQAEGRVVAPRFLVNGSVAYRSPFYLEAFKARIEQNLYDVRELTDHPIQLQSQPNGLPEALILAKRLDQGDTISDLDDQHPYSVFLGK